MKSRLCAAAQPRRATVGVTFAALLLAGVVAIGAREVTERKFVSGGTVRLELDAGEYDIVPSRDDSIRVSWDNGDADVELRIDVQASRATLRTSTPWNDGPKIRIELPRRTNVVLKLSAGELDMNGIEGSKDISALAGDITIGVGERDQYRYVNASVRAGELSVEPFNVSKDGFFRSFEWSGQGRYELRAHLTVGELHLDR